MIYRNGIKGQDATELGPLQREVLEFVWTNPGCSVRDCVDFFNSAGRDYAYTTIKTVCEALHKKRLLSRRRVKNAFRYTPRQSRSGLIVQRLEELLTRFSGAQPVAVSLVDALEEGDPQQLKLLVEELKQRGHLS
jgi:predicted transcriptional regulator